MTAEKVTAETLGAALRPLPPRPWLLTPRESYREVLRAVAALPETLTPPHVVPLDRLPGGKVYLVLPIPDHPDQLGDPTL